MLTFTYLFFKAATRKASGNSKLLSKAFKQETAKIAVPKKVLNKFSIYWIKIILSVISFKNVLIFEVFNIRWLDFNNISIFRVVKEKQKKQLIVTQSNRLSKRKKEKYQLVKR